MSKKSKVLLVALIITCFFFVSLLMYAGSKKETQVMEGQKVIYLAPAATPFSDAVLALLPDFEKESGLSVEVILTPFDQMFQKSILAAANETGEYDLIQLERPTLPRN